MTSVALSRKVKRLLVSAAFLSILACASGVAIAQGIQGSSTPPQVSAFDRTVLPIPDPDYPRSTILDARDAAPPPRFEVTAPAGAPNVRRKQ